MKSIADQLMKKMEQQTEKKQFKVPRIITIFIMAIVIFAGVKLGVFAKVSNGYNAIITNLTSSIDSIQTASMDVPTFQIPDVNIPDNVELQPQTQQLQQQVQQVQDLSYINPYISNMSMSNQKAYYIQTTKMLNSGDLEQMQKALLVEVTHRPKFNQNSDVYFMQKNIALWK